HRSTDGGRTFTTTEVQSFTSTMATDRHQPNVIFASGGNGLNGPPLLVKSVDGGQSFDPALVSFGIVNGIIVDPSDSNILYVAGILQLDFGKPYPTPQEINFVLTSSDGGVTFHDADSGIASPVLALAIDARNLSRLFALTSSGVYKTEDRGATWTLLDAGGETMHRAWQEALLVADPHEANLFYVGGMSLLEVVVGRTR
ncbi:MAG TPA: hypothetical protein VET48_02230, partial [Steroidobacteraceae bacterium]|nr:hypothetical protein [Steroidobacteraceae bacterium]